MTPVLPVHADADTPSTQAVLEIPTRKSHGRRHPLHSSGVRGSSILGSRTWTTLAVCIALLGIAGSVVTSAGNARQRLATSLVAARANDVQIAQTLGLSLQHEDDLLVAAQSFELDNPSARQSSFVQWARNADVMERYPELFAIGAIQVVPRADLGAFAARYPISSMVNSGPANSIAPYPAGVRPYYCLPTMLLVRNPGLRLPRGLDICRAIAGVNLQATKFSGLPALEPARFLGASLLSISVPLYRGMDVPTTVAARRAAFVGFIGVLFNTSVDIATALVGNPNVEVALQYKAAGAPLVQFRGGASPRYAHVESVNLHNGWTVEISSPALGDGVLGDKGALAVLFGGTALSLLLAGVLLILGTGRARARKLVHERTAELRFLALHDPLTGQPNRTLILDRATQMLARARRHHVPTALMFLDLDDFKVVNDTLGHRAGDQLLVAVAARLAAQVREEDTVGRLGGDEFVLLVEGDALYGGVERVAGRILASLRDPIHIADSDRPLLVSASIGIAEGDRATAEELLRDADTALYRAKAHGKHCAVTFNQKMKEAAEDQRSLAADLGHAQEADQFFLVYQPTIDLQSNALTGVEALLRWQHPERGIVEPDDFIPELESSGLIIPVGTWVLNTACRQGAIWQAQGHRFSVSVNVSILQLSRLEFVREVQEALALSGLDPSSLILEFTETTLMRNGPETISQLETLKSLGVRLAVDDFGTGYSSLAYLRQFPMDVVKIDRAFVSGLCNSTEAAALVHALVQLGKALNLQTVAEGVEDDEQRVQLQIEDVDIGQGYLFSKPLALADVEAFLHRYSTVSGLPA
jgi:diguanylate cyclase (GGDEF)-like protein